MLSFRYNVSNKLIILSLMYGVFFLMKKGMHVQCSICYKNKKKWWGIKCCGVMVLVCEETRATPKIYT